MDKIERYVNSLYKDVKDNSQDTEDLKQEMISHLRESAKELQENGIKESESIRIAIEKFGEEFEVRNELANVIKFQKFFARKIFIVSIVLLIFSIVMFVVSHNAKESFQARNIISQNQLDGLRDKFLKEGIPGVDKYAKRIFKDEENNQRTFVAVSKLTDDFNMEKNRQCSPGKLLYRYPDKIELNGEVSNGAEMLTVNGTKYWFAFGTRDRACTDRSCFYRDISILFLAISWVLWIIWSIINIHRVGKLDAAWGIVVVLLSIIGYFIFWLNQISIKRRMVSES